MLEALSCVGQIIQDLRADLGDECEVGLVGVRLNHTLYSPGLWADQGDECEVGLVGVRLNHALYSPGLWAEWFASLYYQKKIALII